MARQSIVGVRTVSFRHSRSARLSAIVLISKNYATFLLDLTLRAEFLGFKNVA
jgi:hypothetical protein